VSVRLADPAATDALGRQLALALPEDASGWLILLKGELGAGKSTLARALLRQLGVTGPVPSPTYTLVEPYEVRGGTVYHVDLYRISGEGELPYLGWPELRQGLVLVEWPERVAEACRGADLAVSLSFDGGGRNASITALSDRAASLPLPGFNAGGVR
jgi:tRNA threonylcarbamoyladenosine biosynthesis protein TsaE